MILATPLNELAKESIQLDPITYELSQRGNYEHLHYEPSLDINQEYTPTQREIELVARAIYGEAAQSPEEEKIAVGYTILNRYEDPDKRFGYSISQILRPSVYNAMEGSRIDEELNSKEWDCGRAIYSDCYDLAELVLNRKLPDPTNGATHYFNPGIVKNPKWPWKRMEKIGYLVTENGESDHKFYREKSLSQ